MAMVSGDLLRRDVRTLGDLLGEVISDSMGTEALELVECVRQLARRRRQGDHTAEVELDERISQLTLAQARVVARAFSIFFDLVNIAEDSHRIRVLRARVRDAEPEPISETIAAGIRDLYLAGHTATQVQQALDALRIELVFTAHPSEAKRRSIRAKLRRMRMALQELDRPDLLLRERDRLKTQLRSELTVLWQTAFLRPRKPTVLEEVERGLSITPRLWEVVPEVYDSLRRALKRYYPDDEFQIPCFLQFGSWMGGDRDGNPHVTAPVTEQTLRWLRETAIRQHLAICQRMYDYLSLSAHEIPTESVIVQQLNERSQQWPELAAFLAGVTPTEVYRRWTRMMEWRLSRSLPQDWTSGVETGGYRDGTELTADLRIMQESLRRHHSQLLAETEVQRWVDLAQVFGLQLTRLDVRQDARRYREIMTELLAALQVTPQYSSLTEPERCALLTKTLPWSQSIEPASRVALSSTTDSANSEAGGGFSSLTADALLLFPLLQQTVSCFGPDALGGHVISLTQQPSDVLNVLWLWRWAQATARHPSDHELRIIPLFETIDDLRHAAEILDGVLQQPLYRDHVARQGNRQFVMVGYSDSTKDGGYLAACWGLYRAQSELTAVAEKHGVAITFFHGRGGSLGRGGGPAARGILSLPPESLDGSLRLTEQGEVLAERYDHTQVAFRHLEQVAWATLTASALPRVDVKPLWREIMEELAQRSYLAYRNLVEQPGFVQFFTAATPIDEIEELPIGSRPARRRGQRTLSDLRAIPWVFSWTQNRCLIPAWYGLGTALTDVKYRDRTTWNAVREMYRQWPFMQATIDNAVLAVAKADMVIAHHYADLEQDPDVRQRCWSLIAAERDRTRQALLDIVGGHELLATTPWFFSSVEARNPYIDPLNLIQVELLRRRRNLPADASDTELEQLRDVLRLTVQGLAAGMRTTG